MRILLDHLYQNLVAELVQDLCFRLLLITCISLFKISCGPLVSSLRSTCARSLFQDRFRPLLPVRPLVQDLSMRILYGHLCKISVSGSLYEDHFGPLVSGSCRTTCTRSLYQDPLDRLCWDPLGPLVQDLCM